MDYLPLVMAMSGLSMESCKESSDTDCTIKNAERKIKEQSDLICEKDVLSTEELMVLISCHSALCQIRSREISNLEKEKRKEDVRKQIEALAIENEIGIATFGTPE